MGKARLAEYYASREARLARELVRKAIKGAASRRVRDCGRQILRQSYPDPSALVLALKAKNVRCDLAELAAALNVRSRLLNLED